MDDLVITKEIIFGLLIRSVAIIIFISLLMYGATSFARDNTMCTLTTLDLHDNITYKVSYRELYNYIPLELSKFNTVYSLDWNEYERTAFPKVECGLELGVHKKHDWSRYKKTVNTYGINISY